MAAETAVEAQGAAAMVAAAVAEYARRLKSAKFQVSNLLAG